MAMTLFPNKSHPELLGLGLQSEGDGIQPLIVIIRLKSKTGNKFLLRSDLNQEKVCFHSTV